MKLLQLGHFIYLLLSAIGFTIQTWIICKEYFAFITNSNIAPIIPTSHGLPSFSLCFSLTSIFGAKRSKTSGPQFFDDQSVVDYILSMKTNEIFASTPNASSFLAMCSYSSMLFGTANKRIFRQECLKYFDVLKYQMLGHMCYRVSINKLLREKVKTIDLEKFANSIEPSQRKLYSLAVDPEEFIGGSKKFFPIAHLSELPYESRNFAMEYLTDPVVNNSFRINFDIFTVTRLPAPYETMCSMHDPTKCYYECVSNKSLPLKIKPQDTILTDQMVNLKIVTNSNLTDAITAQEVKHIKDQCNAICGKKGCHQEYTITLLVLYPGSTYKLGFRMVTTASPVVQIIFTPHMVLYDFVTIIGCLLGIWFSVSGLGLFRQFFRLLPGSTCNSKWNTEQTIKLTKLSGSISSLQKKCQNFQRHIRWRLPDSRLTKSGQISHTLDTLIQNKKFCMLIFNVTIVALFLYHLISVTELYFAYGTLIKLTREIEEGEKEPLKLVVCFYDKDLVSRPYPKIPNQYNLDAIMKSDNWTDYTLKEMFELQFDHSKVLNSCAIRNFTSNRMQYYSSFDECSNHFDIETIYMFHRICYKISPKFNASYSHNEIWSAFSDPFTIYSVTSDIREFTGHHKIRPIIYQRDLPIDSRNFAVDNYILYSNGTYLLSYANYILHFLPSPYSTHCAPNDQFEQFDYTECIVDQALEKLGHLPHSEIYTEPLDYKFLSYELLANKSLAKVYDELEAHCNRVSRDSKCEDSFTKTISSIQYVTKTNFTYVVRTPIYTTTHATAVPRVTFSNFLYDSACCFSFWFGFSIYFFNPFAFFILRSRRKLRFLTIHKLNEVHSQMVEIIQFFGKISLPRSSIVVERSKGKKLFKPIFQKFRRRRARIKFFTDILLIFCCSSHLIYLAEKYFSYQTVIKTCSYDESFDIIPSSILCVEVEEIIKNKTEPITVSQLFNITPTPENLLITCGGRGVPDEFRSLHSNISSYVLNRLYLENDKRGECSKFFDVKRYLMVNHLCYQMKYRNKVKRIHNEFGALKLPGDLYDFGFSQNRTIDRFMAIMAHEKPYTSRLFSSKIWSSRTRNEWIRLTYIKYTSKCLPFPYDQQNYPDMQFDECISLCVAKKTKDTGWVYPLVVVDDSKSEMKVLDQNDAFDPVFQYRFNRALDDCKSQCKLHRKCNKEFTYYVTISYMAGRWPGLSFWLKRTDYPVTKIEFLPKMRLCDLILEAGNIVGIWLGVCVLQVNPFKLLRRRKDSQLDYHVAEEKICARLSDVESDYKEAKSCYNRVKGKFVVFHRNF